MTTRTYEKNPTIPLILKALYKNGVCLQSAICRRSWKFM